MPKQKIGSIKQRILIEGDENLLDKKEILVQMNEGMIELLKVRNASGDIETYAVVPVTQMVQDLEEAFNYGLNSKE